MFERMLFRIRTENSKGSMTSPGFLGKHQLSIKLGIFIFLVLFIHIELMLVVPKENSILYKNKFALILMYILWIWYFVLSAL
jgi:hypothetical protein